MKITISEIKYDRIINYKQKYLQSLSASQELFLEIIVQKGKYYLISEKSNIEIGYVSISEDNILVEFYLKNNYLCQTENIFKSLAKQLSFQKTYCKSFDSVLLKCCLTYYKKFRLVGHLFRELQNKPTIHLSLKKRYATMEDFELIKKADDGFFCNDAEISDYILCNNMIIYSKKKTYVGCGIYKQINENHNNYDIGMFVQSSFRKKGYGTQIITDLVDVCKNNNWHPVCGCAFENVASRKTLEKCGFISKHSLVLFE